jgi:hypothetical protein
MARATSTRSSAATLVGGASVAEGEAGPVMIAPRAGALGRSVASRCAEPRAERVADVVTGVSRTGRVFLTTFDTRNSSLGT